MVTKAHAQELLAIDLGPGAMAEPAAQGTVNYCLSTHEWYAIQSYVAKALSPSIMPHTMQQLADYLGDGAPSDLSDFTKLIAAYKDNFDHCTVWNDETFPESIGLASDVVAYAELAEMHYNAMLPLIDQLLCDPADQRARDTLVAICDDLKAEADGYAARASAVEAKVKNFADQTKAVKTVMSGEDGNGGLMQEYHYKYGSTSQDVQDITDEIAAQNVILKAANKEHDQDMLIAATSATYGWIWPVGTVAAAVVAGVYGDKAVKALEKSKAAAARMAELTDDLEFKAHLMLSIQTVEAGLGGNVASINAALPVIQNIQGIWFALSDDLDKMSGIVQNQIEETPTLIMDLGIEAALNKWGEIGTHAAAYQSNAFITIQP